MLFNIGQPVTMKKDGKLEKGEVHGWRMDRQSYLLLGMPAGTTLKKALAEGGSIEIAVESKGEVFTASGHIKSYLEGTNLWVFEFDEALKRRSLRKDRRISCWIPFRISLERSKIKMDETYREKLEKTFEGKKELPGVITDISMGGMKFFLEGVYHLFANSVFSFTLDLVAGGEDTWFNCRILRVDYGVPGYEKKTFFSGDFVDLEPRAERELIELFHAFHSFIITR